MSEFERDLAEGRKAVQAATSNIRMTVFFDFAREAVRWHTVRGHDRDEVAVGLRQIGTAGALDETAIETMIQLAFARPFVPPTSLSSLSLSASDGHWRSGCQTAANLRVQLFPPVSWVVSGVIPEGLTLLAGKPKVGKSWLALDVCLSVACPRPCLGDHVPTSGDVLYLALEDNPRRLKHRIERILSDDAWPAGLTVATEWRRLDDGGVDDIGDWINGASAPRLVVIDTLAAVRPERQRSSSLYSSDYSALAPLQRLAAGKRVAILVLHHLRKLSAEDPVDTVSGTLGLSGSADTILVLARSTKGTTFYCRGRDVEEFEQAIEFNPASCTWTLLGDAASVRRSDERQHVLAALTEGKRSVAEIAAATGMDRGNLDRLLYSMTRDGDVRRVGRGVYAVADETR